MRRVTWPNRKQVEGTTAVVIFSVFAFAGYFAIVDGILAKASTAYFRSSRSRQGMDTEENVPFDEQPEAGSRAEAETAEPEPRREPPPRRAGGSTAPRRAPRPGLRRIVAKKWYIIHTYSGFENKVAESLAHALRSLRFRG